MLFKNNLNNLFQSNLCSIFAHIKLLKEVGMRLSELKTGEKGVIIKVLGHGGFRKRIIEMGFISNRVEEQELMNSEYQRDVVEGTVQGVANYFSHRHKIYELKKSVLYYTNDLIDIYDVSVIKTCNFQIIYL